MRRRSWHSMGGRCRRAEAANRVGRAAVVLGLLTAWLMLLPAGCGSQPARKARSESEPPGDEGEPNDSFVLASKAPFGSGSVARLTGSIDEPDDLDVIDLGPVNPGQRVVADLQTLTDGFDASLGLFDADLSLVMDNDDRDLANLELDPYFDHVVRHGGESYFLVIGRSAFAGFTPESGEYELTVRVTGGANVPDPKGQTIYLNFDGGEIEPDNLLVKVVDPFDAADIGPGYAGQDDVIKQVIIEIMLENYEPFDVTVVTDPAQLPPEGEYSTVMFGSRNSRAFGISEAVDHYNDGHGDMAVVFTASFDPFQFTATPSAEELGVAIGNIAAHEAGHLLGLNHVDDTADLMDAVSPADTFLADQDFTTSPLSSDILPIGFQNGPLLLSESVGLLEGFALQQPRLSTVKAGPRLRDPDARSWCGTCNRKLGQ